MGKPEERSAIASIVRAAMKDAHGTLKQVIESGVEASHFQTGEASELFRAVLEKIKQGQRFHHGLAKLTDGAQKVAQWAVSLPDADPLGHALAGLAQSNINSLIADGLRKALAALQAGDYSEAQALARSIGDLAPVAQEEIRGIAKVAADMFAEAKLGRRSVKTGIADLDRFIGGLPANLTVIGAQPGVGKSGFLGSMALSMAAQGMRVGILSLEDASPWLPRRLVAQALRVPVRDILEAKDRPHLLERIGNATTELATQFGESIFMADAVKPTIQQACALMEKMLFLKKVNAVFLDHIGELSLSSENRFDLEVGNALSAIRGIATRHGVPVVVFAHTKRSQGEDGKPRATDFANSADMERKARLALALKREPESDELQVHVVKNTEGPAGSMVTLPFDLESGMVKL